MVVADEGVVLGGIFAGEDEGFGVEAVFESVEAGSGLALGGAGSGRFERVGAIGGDLSWGCHISAIAGEKVPFPRESVQVVEKQQREIFFVCVTATFLLTRYPIPDYI